MIYPGVEQGAAGVEVVVRQWGERLLEGYERNALVGWEWGSRSRVHLHIGGSTKVGASPKKSRSRKDGGV